MNPVQYIRKAIFRMTQASFASVLGVSQPTVARWERDGNTPADHQPNVRVLGREICKSRNEAWQDLWFFEVPSPTNIPSDEAA